MIFFMAAVLFLTADHFAGYTSTAIATNTSSKAGRVGKPQESPKPSEGERDGNASASTSAIIGEIQLRTYLKHICFFDMLATVIRVLIDNTTLSILSLQEENEVKASLTMINGVQSFLMIPMQLASGPFFTHFGVMYGISLLPVTVFMFGVSTFVSNVRRSCTSCDFDFCVH